MIKFRPIEGNVFFTSDTHAFHKNIAKGTSQWKEGYRDFNNEIEMTQHIADNINKMVGEHDTLVHCGDWSFGGKQNIEKFAKMLTCKNIVMIIGNHDHHMHDNVEFPSNAIHVADVDTVIDDLSAEYLEKDLPNGKPDEGICVKVVRTGEVYKLKSFKFTESE